MNISYEGIGQIVISAKLGGTGLTVGTPVLFTASGTVSAAGDGKKIDGVVLSAREDYGAVAVAGFVTLPCAESVTVGRCKIVADGAGGVKVGSTGCEVLVVAVENGAATMLL